MTKKKATKLIEKAIDALIDIRDDAYEYWKETMQRAVDSLNTAYYSAKEKEEE